MTRHLPLDEFDSIHPTDQLCLSVALAIPPAHSLHYFFGVVQDCANEPGGTTASLVRAAARMEMALCVIEVLLLHLLRESESRCGMNSS